ncbi:histidinol-phosphatase [Thioalkalivibrio sp. ALE21]|uniref:inositol monophosphatase family protein n=1 Tax=Thioalkalivibrio sp. ALE21 TaxID=1158175 RepID=UPI000D89986C|nr:inositol monophosphatase family protein [Thioalkalivibrio sp. ALE21]PYG03234.1 histidinol-phosphatase [Thioalkalivibrio sp. ALE21]
MQASPFLEAAQAAADAAEKVIRHYYEHGVDVETKADDTPVTRADVESEEAIRSVIRERFPDHGFYGEETGQSDMDSDYVWLIDPIDGTKSFVRRYPFFSTQIALMYKGELVLGLSNGPQFGERAWAEKGQGAFLNGERIGVEKGITAVDRATLSTGNLRSLAARGDCWNALGGIVAEVNRVRGYGDFYHYHLLASGSIDCIVESDVNILDIAALAVIVREAGGTFTDLAGGELDLDTGTVLAAGTPELHATLRERLGWS